MKGKILNYLHEVEKIISIISVQVIEQIGFPLLKKIDFIFKRLKQIFCSKIFFIKIGNNEFSFLINGFDNSSKYQRIHFNEFQDRIIVANNFT